MADGAVGGAGVVVIDINEVQENGGALDVAQEVVTKTFAVGGALDQTWNVGDEEVLVVDGGDAELGSQGGKGVVGDFGAGVGDATEKSGLAGIGQADEADVGDEFQLEGGFEGFTWFANLGDHGGLAGGGLEVGVTEATVATARDHCLGAVVVEVGQLFPVAANDGADGDFDDEVFAGATGAALAGAVFAVFGFELGIVAEVKEGIGIFVGTENDRATAAAVAAVGAAFGDVDFVAEGDGAVATFAGLEFDFGGINEHAAPF